MVQFNTEFGDSIVLEISKEGRLELTLDNGSRCITSWLNASQVDRLIMELKIMKHEGLIKYSDEIGKE